MNVEPTDLLGRLSAAVELGTPWMTSHLSDQGEFVEGGDDLASYYKAVLLFPVAGWLEAGGKALRHVKAHLTGPDGVLCSRSGKKTSLVRMQRNLANYMDGWVAIGAWLLGDYTFARGVAENLKRFQAPHGGIATGPVEWALRERFDLATTASCGRAFLMLGHQREAMRAGEFIVRVLQHQTQDDTGLQLSFGADWSPTLCEDPSEETYYRFDPTRRGEKVWFPAFSAAFLCELSQVAGTQSYVDVARRYYEFIRRTPEFGDQTLGNGKSAWAAGLLFQITGEPKYLKEFQGIVPNVLAWQGLDGEFGSAGAGGGSGRSSTPMPRRYERTAEFTTWCGTYLRMLATEGGRMEAPS